MLPVTTKLVSWQLSVSHEQRNLQHIDSSHRRPVIWSKHDFLLLSAIHWKSVWMVSSKYKVSNKNEVHWWIKFPDMNTGHLTNCCNPCINSSAPYIICITECYLQNDDNAIIIKILEIALGYANYALSYHKFLYGFYGQNIPKNVISWIITVIVPQIISTWFTLFLIWILFFRVSLLE